MSMEHRSPSARDGRVSRPTAACGVGNSAFTTVSPSQQTQSSQAASVTNAHGAVATPSAATTSKKARKERGPNWEKEEVLLLIQAKKLQHDREKSIIDPRDNMIPENTKWRRIADEVTRGACSPCPRDGQACKTKWNQLLPDYKKIADYSSRTGRDFRDYCIMHPAEKKEEGLPRLFNEDFFNAIDHWFRTRPVIQPPHVRDLLSPTDGNYKTPESTDNDNNYDSDVDPFQDMPNPFLDSTGKQQSRSPGCHAVPAPAPPSPRSTPAPTTSATKHTSATRVPSGIVPLIISSSDTSQTTGNRKVGNTGVRRKNLAGHTVIAEATKATGAALAAQMQGVAEASLLVERSKVDFQERSFNQHMAYLERRDARLQDNVAIANENARLAIQKQGEMVSCLAQLSYVLGQGVAATRASSPAIPMPMRPPSQEEHHYVPAAGNQQSVHATYEEDNNGALEDGTPNIKTTQQ